MPKKSTGNIKTLPLDIVGSNEFGRYSKISIAQTYNMIISDDWLVPYAGYEKVATLLKSGKGRGLYSSARYNHMICVVEDSVFTIGNNLSVSRIATIDSLDGNVFISENNADQIAICDQTDIYIFDYRNNTFNRATLDFTPGYITFQDGYFIAPASDTSEWRLSAPNNGLSWPSDSASVGELQTKPDEIQACVRFPGKGNLLLVFGKTVTEFWYDTGTGLFPYQKNTFNNIDYGCLNKATIAIADNAIFWIGANERSGPVIMMTDGNSSKQISNDGINFKLATLKNPDNCYGFCFKQDGHYFYQVTWPLDRLTYTFDITTGKFFTLCDRFMNAHIAKQVEFFNGGYYFISYENGNLYELNSQFTTYDGEEIPRIRACKPIRLPDQSRFVVNNVGFTMEQGEYRSIEAVDFSFSKDGGASFGSIKRRELNILGHRPNRMQFWRCGIANDFTVQFRFWGHGRFLATNGEVEIYQ